MLPSSKLKAIAARLRTPAFAVSRKDPRAPWRVVAGVLAAANLLAFFFVLRPIGGSPAELDEQLGRLRQQVQTQQANISNLRLIVKKVETARKQQELFMATHFMDRRTTSSTILSEILNAAKAAGLKTREHTFVIDPVEGSDTILMMTITANYEGTYADLVQFVNQVDRSKRFLIIDNIAAAPQQAAGMLSSRFKINTFVRDTPLPSLPAGVIPSGGEAPAAPSSSDPRPLAVRAARTESPR